MDQQEDDKNVVQVCPTVSKQDDADDGNINWNGWFRFPTAASLPAFVPLSGVRDRGELLFKDRTLGQLVIHDRDKLRKINRDKEDTFFFVAAKEKLNYIAVFMVS